MLKLVEPKYNVSVSKFNLGNIDTEAVFTIVGFIAFISCCTPASRRITSTPFNAFVKNFIKQAGAEGKLSNPPKTFDGRTLLDLLDNNIVKLNIHEKYPQAVAISTILERMSIWGNRKWDIYINDHEDSPFFTSDNPLTVQSNSTGGINRIVPLTPTLAVKLHHQDKEDQNRSDLKFNNFRWKMHHISRKEARDINTLVVQCAEQTVYFSKKLGWVEEFVRKHASARLETVVERLMTDKGLIEQTEIRVVTT